MNKSTALDVTEFQDRWLAQRVPVNGLCLAEFVLPLVDAALVAGFAYAVWFDGPIQLAIAYSTWVCVLPLVALLAIVASIITSFAQLVELNAERYKSLRKMAKVIKRPTIAKGAFVWSMRAWAVAKIVMICAAGPWWMILAGAYTIAWIVIWFAGSIAKASVLTVVKELNETNVTAYEAELAKVV